MKLAWISLVIGAVVVFGARLDAEEAGNPTDDLNLLQNGDFAQWDGNNPVHWNVIAGSPVRVEGSNGLSETPQFIHVEADAPVRGSYGQIAQRVDVEPNRRYLLEGDVLGDKAGVALLQVKRLKDGKEVERINTDPHEEDTWSTKRLSFDTGDAVEVWVVLRWRQNKNDIGKRFGFADLRLSREPSLTPNVGSTEPYAVPTFHCVGLYWKPDEGAADRSCKVSYRREGEDQWREALPLWFDVNQHEEPAAQHTHEYRGSIVGLDPGTTYEVKLDLEGDAVAPTRQLSVTTWDDKFPIARQVDLPASVDETYVITEGGNERDGYVLYTVPEGQDVVWDARGELESNLKVNASYVIVRGLTLKNAATHGIELGDVHHVVIEHCDISGWGRIKESDGFGMNLDGGVYGNSSELRNIVVQHCDIHHPRSDANSWNEDAFIDLSTKTTRHPLGPQAVVLRRGQGQYVVRHNRFYSDWEHMFNDAIGEVRNFSFEGFPRRDSDVYGNFISHCWDDAIEVEGADMNVRVWDNYMTMTYGGIGAASPSLGPLYLFRNVYAASRKSGGTAENDFRGHYLVKLGHADPRWARGRLYVFHNTALQPPPFAQDDDPASGIQAGVVLTSRKYYEENIMTRNNILVTRFAEDAAIRDWKTSTTNDFDFDLYNGKVIAQEGSESNGLVGTPTYQRAPDGRLWLKPGTIGHDAAALLPNFNDNYVGQGPDIGAVETGSSDKPALWPAFPIDIHEEP